MQTSSGLTPARPQISNWPGTSPRHRIAAALTAASITAAIGSALLSSFYFVSPGTEWLEPTDAVLAQVARCERNHERAQQKACKQQFVTAQLSKSPAAVQVARR